MESKDIIDLQERIEHAVSNIETLEKEAVSFSKTKQELQGLAISLSDYINNQKANLIELQELVKHVKSSLVEETLKKFESNIERTQLIFDEIYQKISNNLINEIKVIKEIVIHDFQKQSKSNTKKMIFFGVFSVIVVISNVLINLFIL